MSNLYKTALSQAMVNTTAHINQAKAFFTNNEKRFRLVLSHRKADALMENMNKASYATTFFNQTEEKTLYNNGYVTAKEQFENLPEQTQLLRLRHLNQTIHNALNSEKTPIHIKCHQLEKEFKAFHKQTDEPHKTSEFSRASEELTKVAQPSSTEKIAYFAMGL